VIDYEGKKLISNVHFHTNMLHITISERPKAKGKIWSKVHERREE
jgi:hypothetical protein